MFTEPIRLIEALPVILKPHISVISGRWHVDDGRGCGSYNSLHAAMDGVKLKIKRATELDDVDRLELAIRKAFAALERE
jgi:hypothetical protein